MKKKILSGIAIVAFAAIAGLNVKMNQQESNLLANLDLSSIEALAGEATPCKSYGSGNNDGKCERAYNETDWSCNDARWYQSKDCKK